MIPLQATGDAALTWMQTDRRGKHFALRAGDAVVATLDLPNAWNTTATAHVGDSAWTLQRAGFRHPHLVIRVADDSATFAAAGRGKSQVTLRDGRVFGWRPGRDRKGTSAFIDQAGQSAAVFTPADANAYSVQITPPLRDESAGALLAILGMYLIVESLTAAMIAATTATYSDS